MSTFHLVYNPVAGRGRVSNPLQRVRTRIEAHGGELIEFVTAAPGDASSITATLPSNATVLAMGGDGTVQAVASECIGTERTLGVLPAGSGDDFAFALGIDRHDLEGAIDRVLTGTVKLVDTGVANGRRFINAAGTGFDAEVAVAALRAPPYLRERNAYLYGIFKTLSRLASAQVEIVLDGELVHDQPALLVSVQNGPRSGGAFPLAPGASNDDGLLDVVIAGQFNRLKTLGILPRVMAGTHTGHPRVRILRGRTLTIQWSVPRPAHLEGELLPPCDRYEMAIDPKSLRVLV